ncbi:MAG TPA: carbonic anhydrase family protein [Dyella sp.]|uniref:carbonic anhydrase family protein n=1 Tax=Dyella sp. TaxID=1869338 RepID=UPI002F94C90A
MNTPACCDSEPEIHRRRTLLKAALGAAALGSVGFAGLGISGPAYAQALTEAERDRLTPDGIIEMLKAGNERFRTGKMQQHDYLAQKRATIGSQYPAAMILSCIDSRAPAEIIMDTGIGDAFNARVAGNVVNDDLIGSMEFACRITGAKVIVVMGHTACGAIKGAIDGAQLGHLTALLDKIKPAVAATHYDGERTSKNAAFVDEVAKTNVHMNINEIRQHSSVLADLEREGKIKMVGALYRFEGGRVEFLDA